jgi:hypothetical protein
MLAFNLVPKSPLHRFQPRFHIDAVAELYPHYSFIFGAVIHAPSAHPWRMKRRLLRAATVKARIRCRSRSFMNNTG